MISPAVVLHTFWPDAPRWAKIAAAWCDIVFAVLLIVLVAALLIQM
jgi:hypothetical protein